MRNTRPVSREEPTQTRLPQGVELAGAAPASAERILSADALAFVADLVRRFAWRREELLQRRTAEQLRLDAGGRLSFPADTRHLREASWTVAPLPADLQDRRVEITGPTDRKMIINALNSGARVFMADFEDSTSPTFDNVVDGQENLCDAVRRVIDFTAPDTGKRYRLNERTAVLMVRPRGWHLLEKHLRIDGQPAPASLVDFGLYFFHNAAEFVARGTGPYFYLPKMESYLEARLWNDVFLRAQERLGIPRGTIKATVLIETLPAAFEMDEILWELREHSAGLNCGRWDYIFSFIKKNRMSPQAVVPDRAQLTMDKGFLRAYVQLLIQTCHRRGVHAMGGMAAQIPIKDDPKANEEALAKVRADKLREVKDGHDGTWVAHPGLVPLAQAIFDEGMPTPNQIARERDDVQVTANDLLAVPDGTRTEAGLRHNIRVGVRYLEAWLRGQGCVPLYSLMEDAATAEISRAQCWQWLYHGATLDDGQPLTLARFRRVLDEEMEALRLTLGKDSWRAGRFDQAERLFTELTTSTRFEEFLTLPAYDRLIGESGFATATTALADGAANDTPAPYHPDAHRWDGVVRTYTRADVERLRPSVQIRHTLAELGAVRLWELMRSRPFVHSLGAVTGNQAVQMVRAGLEAVYVSGWQVAADANSAGQTYPDQSLYPADSVPTLVRRINRALERADLVEKAEGRVGRRWQVPLVADAEAGFGGPLNAYELMKNMIEAGAAGVHFEDQVSAEKKCGHLGGKVLVPTGQFVRTLTAARLAADVLGVPTLLIARTDANSAQLITTDVDPRDRPFIEDRERTSEGFYRIKGGIDYAIARSLAYAPYADMLWCETATPDLTEARRFAEAVHAQFPDKLLAYNCSPSFNWKKKLTDSNIARFQRELGEMGYAFQFVTLAGFHALNYSMFKLASDYRDRDMAAYTELQQAEFSAEREGYTATRHQREVGTGYFDLVTEIASGGEASTQALEGSTETAQFKDVDRIAQVQAALDDEHTTVEKLTYRLRTAPDVSGVLSVLEELKNVLAGHFAREEADQGLYGLLAARAPAYRSQLEALVHEHKEILVRVKVLADFAQNDGAEKAINEAVQLAARLRDHELRENDLAREALTGKGGVN